MTIPVTHHVAAWLCQLSYHPDAPDYEDGETFARITIRRDWRCPVCGDEDRLDVFARVDLVEDRIYVSVQGTNAPKDWLANLDVRSCRLPSTRGEVVVANGWRHGASALLQPVIKALQEAGDRVIIVTGHSKGAAEASILAYLLHYYGYPVADLVTFGSPRPGKQEFVKASRRIRITRYVNGPDPVTWAPLWLTGYRHVGRTVQLAHPLASLWRVGRDWGHLISRHHAMHQYTQALEAHQ